MRGVEAPRIRLFEERRESFGGRRERASRGANQARLGVATLDGPIHPLQSPGAFIAREQVARPEDDRVAGLAEADQDLVVVAEQRRPEGLARLFAAPKLTLRQKERIRVASS